MAGRGEVGLDDLVGMFVNTVVLRTRVEPGMGFGAVLDLVREVDLGAFAHGEVPFERVVDELAPAPSTAHTPLFQVVLELVDGHGLPWWPGLVVEPVDLDPGVAKFDLQLSVAERFDADGAPAGLAAGFTYATDVFDEATVRGVVDRFVRVLVAVSADPEVVVGDVGILDATERRALERWNRPGVETGSATLAGMFADRAARTPEALAVACGDATVTYGELAASANRLARHLVRLGVGPDSLVAVALPRSTELVVAFTAVLAAGGAYVPIDVSLPVDRVGFILGDADPVCVLTTTEQADTLEFGALPVVLLDAPETAAHLAELSTLPMTDAQRRAPLRPDAAAYLIYTSGSTGVPRVCWSRTAARTLSPHASRDVRSMNRSVDDVPFAELRLLRLGAVGALCRAARGCGRPLRGRRPGGVLELLAADGSRAQPDPDRFLPAGRRRGIRGGSGSAVLRHVSWWVARIGAPAGVGGRGGRPRPAMLTPTARPRRRWQQR